MLLLALEVMVSNVWPPSPSSCPIFLSLSEFELLLGQENPAVSPPVNAGCPIRFQPENVTVPPFNLQSPGLNAP